VTAGPAAAAPLSPHLIAGLAAAPVPLAPIQPVLAAALGAMRARHPELFGRLARLGGARFRIVPTDLPFDFALDTAPARLRAVRRDAPLDAGATVRGPIATLLALLEGGVDGDALFFGRDLAVEGDLEAVVALRNALDGAEIDIPADLAAGLGLLREPARHAIATARQLHCTLFGGAP